MVDRRPVAGAQVRAQSVAPSLVHSPGVSTSTLTVQLRNTGSVAWPVPYVHLTVSSPGRSPEPLAGGSTRQGAFAGDLSRPEAAGVVPGHVA